MTPLNNQLKKKAPEDALLSAASGLPSSSIAGNNHGIRKDIISLLEAQVLFDHIQIGMVQRFNTPAITEQILALFTSHEKALLEQLEAALPKENQEEEWFTVPSGQTVQNKDLHNYKAGYNQALADVRTIIGDLK